MKELTIKNINSATGKDLGSNGNSFIVTPVVPQTEAGQCTVNFVEVAPGSYAFGYHYHEMNEEVFYIISGKAIVRTANGDVTLDAGDAITFPPGPDGAHVIRNASQTETLKYIDFGTNNKAEIVHLPDMNKIMVIGPYSNGMYEAQ